MTKDQAKEFVKLNPGAIANYEPTRLMISQDRVRQGGIINVSLRREGESVEDFLNGVFVWLLPENGWNVILPA